MAVVKVNVVEDVVVDIAVLVGIKVLVAEVLTSVFVVFTSDVIIFDVVVVPAIFVVGSGP